MNELVVAAVVPVQLLDVARARKNNSGPRAFVPVAAVAVTTGAALEGPAVATAVARKPPMSFPLADCISRLSETVPKVTPVALNASLEKFEPVLTSVGAHIAAKQTSAAAIPGFALNVTLTLPALVSLPLHAPERPTLYPLGGRNVRNIAHATLLVPTVTLNVPLSLPVESFE